MWRLTVFVLLAASAQAQNGAKTGDELVSTVLSTCVDADCVKTNVLGYLDNLLNVNSAPGGIKNVDAAIFKRAAKVLKTHEFRVKLPEVLFDNTEIVYNPQTGLDVASNGPESRGMMLKKKLLLPILLLLKLKMKALMPIFVALIGLKSLKALILSKLALIVVIGFVAYQLLGKSGMPMAMSMAPAEPPTSLYGPPAPTAAPPSSYEPSWEANQGGPYSRIWTSNNDNSAQNIAYSAYYPGASSSTTRP